MTAPSSFLAELKRRKVFRVAVVYVATAFLVLQAADIMLPRLGVPDWALSFLVVLVVLGLPIALVMAWALELTPEGVKVTRGPAASDPAEPAPSLLGGRTLALAGILVALGVGLGAGWILKPAGTGSPTAAAAIGGVDASAGFDAGDREADESIAVLAFADLSPEGDQGYFADGIAEEILNALVRIEGLRVAGRTSSFHFKGRNEDLRTIGATLGVAHVLEGSVRKQADRVRITAQLVRSDDGFHLWSETYDGDLSDIFELQERIARAITGELRLVLRGEQQDQLVPVATSDPEAYALYLEASEVYNRREGPRFVEAMTKLERALEIDPGFARARSRLAALHALSPSYTGELPEAAQAAAQRHARLAIERDPAMAEPHAVLAYLFQQRRKFADAYDAYERALERNPDDLTAMFWFAAMLAQTGHLARSITLLERVLAIDPLLPNALVWRGGAYLEAGDMEAAEPLLLRARQGGIAHVENYLGEIALARGRRQEAIRLIAVGLGAMLPGQSADFSGSLARGIVLGGAVRDSALARIEQYLASDPAVLTGTVEYALLRLGEPDKALALVGERPTANDAVFFLGTLWGVPPFDARRRPGFPEFARRTGLAELWERHGPPDACRRVAPLDHRCD
jgi:TolB-like protein